LLPLLEAGRAPKRLNTAQFPVDAGPLPQVHR